MPFHSATKYYALSDSEPGDERIGIGDPANRTAAIWQKDWNIKPLLYKVYVSLPPIDCRVSCPDTGMPALAAIATTGAAASSVVPDKALLGRLGLLTNGSLDRTWTTPDGREHHYRTAGGTGALYHLELYFVCADLADLAAGVYHYSAIDHTLRQVRAGDFRAALVDATGRGAVDRRRTRRAGGDEHVLAQRLALPGARLPAHLLGRRNIALAHPRRRGVGAGRGDARVRIRRPLVNALLDVEGTRESDRGARRAGPHRPGAARAGGHDRLDLPTQPLSTAEVTFHALTDYAPRLLRCRPARTPRAGGRAGGSARRRQPTGPLTELRPLPTDQLDARPPEQIIFRRRSTRNYDTDVEIPFDAFSTLLDRSTRGVASDVLVPGAPLTELYLIVNGVEGLVPGVYLHHPQLGAVELLREGTFRAAASRIAADQRYAGDAHVNLYYLAHLPSILARYGNRGYRLAQLEGALHAGKLHLGTHALGLGAVGSTPFDDEVVEFFSPHAAGKDYAFVTVFGKRRRSART